MIKPEGAAQRKPIDPVLMEENTNGRGYYLSLLSKLCTIRDFCLCFSKVDG